MESGLRRRERSSDEVELSLVEGSGLGWREAVTGGGDRSQVQESDLR